MTQISAAEAAAPSMTMATLEELIRTEEVQLALQPIVDATSARPMACEALLRSAHPGFTNPTELFAVAEAGGCVHHVSAIIARRVARILDGLPAHMKLFMNIHPAEFGDPVALEETLSPLKSVAGRVVIEITERRRLTEVNGWQTSVQLLSSMGFAIAVDDLGAGYSSLSVLAELQPQYIKVDMSIVRNVHADERKQRLMGLLVHFANATSTTIVAEGVEQIEEVTELVKLGVHLLQGYHFGRPRLDYAF